MSRLYRNNLLVYVLLAASLMLVTTAAVSAHEGPPAEDESGFDRDPLPEAAEQVASQTGLSVEEAHAALLRQPAVGDFRVALERQGPKPFAGLFIEYEPEYRIVLLASEGRGEQVRQAALELATDDLDPYLVVRETRFTEDVLERERNRLIQLGTGLLTTTDVDVPAGRILATVATADNEKELRARLERAEPRIEAREVVIWQGVSQQEDSLGGIGTILTDNSSPCTTGFSVKRLSDGVEGVVTAAHCGNGNRYILHHPSVMLVRVQGQDSGSLDVEWHKTPGLDDIKKIRWHQDGSRWDISGRVGRSNMVINNYVCTYGKATSKYQCGQIKSLGYQPVTGSHNPTFIKVDTTVDTRVGDSGAPWFLGGDAYGIHTGTNPAESLGLTYATRTSWLRIIWVT